MVVIKYLIVIDMGFTEHAVDIPCTLKNDKFVEPRIRRYIKANKVLRCYRIEGYSTKILKSNLPYEREMVVEE